MKELDELNIPDTLRYTPDHEWVGGTDGAFRSGITDYAQDQLGDIVFVELPEPGKKFSRGEEFGTVESVKAVSELYMPVTGIITNVNSELNGAPELVNTDPYGAGWMIKIAPEDPETVDELLDKDEYIEQLGTI